MKGQTYVFARALMNRRFQGCWVSERVRRLVACVWPEKADAAVCSYKCALVSAFMAWAGMVAVVAASDATPPPDVPPAALCTVEAPSLAALNAAILIPPAGASPVAARTPGVVPEGVPADPETVAAVTAVVRELIGCYNAGEPLRTFALFTESYLFRLFNRQGGFTRESYDGYATPEPAADPNSHTAILEIRDVRVLEDGTAGATVILRYASVPMPKAFFFAFARVGDRWLIDGILGEISFSVP